MSVIDNYHALISDIGNTVRKAGRDPSEVSLIAVTKGFSLEHVLPAYKAGARGFGENRVQEALPKIEKAPKDIEWHLIGTLQKNKVRKVIGKFSLIHSVDSLELAQKISETSLVCNTVTPVLLQANTSGEQSKHGLQSEEWIANWDSLLELEGIDLQGLMTIAPFVDDEKVIRRCFRALRQLRDRLQAMAGNKCTLKHLSMGMSHDYRLAINEGATQLRIGSAIFH
ncbi:YggS family pyridoxal phosphate-dependent enzyme [Waddlia chondrophila]|uniref:Pyridoxal phosphate homeostasis protein n=1 Tax=Waddlia chondrophila (strain ATCC VR-1470 / WSU 86-1044) TaxID=716544 RepID=D6YWQ5_WADCW|nr:YggS family pyridoxal phosphate-dependent enzyme [Waddlia chondrophila]ADI38566.1 conserved hypothetical protein [Waddlia chondrophila WSU 86-1044]